MTAHMTDPVTHMCWSEQISPLAYLLQATWQAFNLSHCIEMPNTHPLSRAGQLSQMYFTHSAPILALRNQPSTVNKQWPPLWESRMSHHTRFKPAEKRKLLRCTVYFLVQIQFTGWYDHWSESDFVSPLGTPDRSSLSRTQQDLPKLCNVERTPSIGTVHTATPAH